MSAEDVVKYADRAHGRFYLDTSAVFGVGGNAQEITAVMQAWGQRAARLRPLVSRARAGKVELLTSMLAIQEVAAVVRNSARSNAARNAGHADWKALVQALGRAEASAMDAEGPHKTMLRLLTLVMQELDKAAVKVTEPAIPPGFEVERARERRKHHRELVRTFVQLDAMDALHIAIGAELGVKGYVSFDQGWATTNALVLA